MYLPIYAEFASAEFGAFEFGLEVDSGVPVEWTAAGSATAAFGGGRALLSRLIAPGSTTVSFIGQSHVNSTLQAGASSSTSLLSSVVLNVDWTAPASSAASFSGGIAKYGELSSVGYPVIEFFSLTDAGFDIAAGSSAAWVGAAIATVGLSTSGASSAEFGGQAVMHGAFDADGGATVGFQGQRYAMGGVSDSGHSSASFVGGRVRIAQLTSSATSLFTARGSKLHYGALTAAGESATAFGGTFYQIQRGTFSMGGAATASFDGAKVVGARLISPGLSFVEFKGSLARIAGLTATGKSSVDIRAGKPVLRFMPWAYDVLIRPEEPREAIRPEENRGSDWK